MFAVGIALLVLLQHPTPMNPSEGKGYIGTYTDKNKKIYTQYIQGADAPWAKNSYWGGTMKENGCGITALSIITSGYGYSLTPEDFRKKYSPHLEGNKIPDVLKEEFKINNSGFCYAQKEFNQERILNSLEKGQPVLICVTNKPNSKWTKKSHYMVLLGCEGDKIYVCNPSQGDEKNKKSGWYEAKEVIPYIVKAVYIKEKIL